MDLTNLWRPQLRGQIEQNISLVAQGLRSKDAVLDEAIRAFSDDYAAAHSQAYVLEAEVRDIVFGRGNGTATATLPGAHPPSPPGSVDLGACTCGGGHLRLCPGPSGGPPHIACDSWPLHRFRVDLPRMTTSVAVADDVTCSHCHARMLELGFTRALLPPGFPPRLTACVACDPTLKRLLELVGPVARPTIPRGHAHQQDRHPSGRTAPPQRHQPAQNQRRGAGTFTDRGPGPVRGGGVTRGRRPGSSRGGVTNRGGRRPRRGAS